MYAEHPRLRPACPADLPAILAIYEPEVHAGTATFELEPPDLGELGRRLARVQALGLPWLVAELDGAVAGYAYAVPCRDRPAYRFTVEDSVYVAAAARGRGVGGALLGATVAASAAAGMRQMVAVIGDSANEGSIRLHRAHGFAPVGTLRGVGFKLGRWLDTVLMQRALWRHDPADPRAFVAPGRALCRPRPKPKIGPPSGSRGGRGCRAAGPRCSRSRRRG